jgi:hypothetical protein
LHSDCRDDLSGVLKFSSSLPQASFLNLGTFSSTFC